MTPDRRAYLKATGAAVSAAAVGACAPDSAPPSGDAAPLDPGLLRAVGELVLPPELGEAGRRCGASRPGPRPMNPFPR